MKLDVNSLRYLSKEEWRVLGSVELGQRNVRLALFWLTQTFDNSSSYISVTAARNGTQGADCHNSKPKVSVGL